MYRTLIWATDGSAGADAALPEIVALQQLGGGRLVVVHCDHRLNGRGGSWSALADEDDCRAKIRRQVAGLRKQGIDAELIIRRSHSEAADVVAAVAAEEEADVIVCGTRGLGAFAGAFLGSFTQRLLHVAPCSVLAVRGRAETVASAEQSAGVEARA
jgi:nucleotide-binding universal stress UspA family protein